MTSKHLDALLRQAVNAKGSRPLTRTARTPEPATATQKASHALRLMLGMTPKENNE